MTLSSLSLSSKSAMFKSVFISGMFLRRMFKSGRQGGRVKSLFTRKFWNAIQEFLNYVGSVQVLGIL